MMDQSSRDVSYEDFPNICRSCSNRGTLKPLQALEYINLYQLLIESKVSQDDGLPYQMCSACVDKLQDIQVFAMGCKNNEYYLRRILSEAESIQCQNNLIRIENEEEPGPPSPRNSDEDEVNEESKLEDLSSTTKPKGSYSRKAQPSNCEICQTSFKTKKALLTHQLKNPSCKVKNHKCTSCNKAFFTKSKLLIHIRTHTSDTPFECKDCFKRFRHQSSLKRHVEVVHEGLKPFKCEICGKEFTSQKAMVDHGHIHKNDKPYSCSFCKSQSTTYSEHFCHEVLHKIQSSKTPSRHFKLTKTDKPELQCTICLKTFISAKSIYQHSHAQAKKKFLCNTCGKPFAKKSQLEAHVRIHSGVKPFECKTCKKTFRHLSTLTIHTRTHSGAKPYTCNVCSKSFVQCEHLKQHMRIHTGEKPYKCLFCGKTFAMKCNLVVHNRIHTGETPYKCLICGKGFCNSSGLKRHQGIHEKMELKDGDV